MVPIMKYTLNAIFNTFHAATVYQLISKNSATIFKSVRVHTNL